MIYFGGHPEEGTHSIVECRGQTGLLVCKLIDSQSPIGLESGGREGRFAGQIEVADFHEIQLQIEIFTYYLIQNASEKYYKYKNRRAIMF